MDVVATLTRRVMPGPAVDPVPTAGRDAAELLDVQMQQFPG